MKEIIDNLNAAIKNNDQAAIENELAKIKAGQREEIFRYISIISELEIANLLLNKEIVTKNQEYLQRLYFSSVVGVDKKLLEKLLPFIKNKEELNSDGDSILHTAVITLYEQLYLPSVYREELFTKYKEIIDILLNAGLRIDTKNKHGHPIFFLAIELGFFEFFKYLIEEKHIDINAKHKDDKTLLMYAIEKKDFDIVEYLVKQKADLKAQDNEGKTALHYALKSGNSEVVTSLIVEQNIDINAQDNKGKTALHYAAEQENSDIFIYLVEHGADINIQDIYNKIALHIAARKGNLKVVSYLIEEKKQNVNAIDRDGKTVLHHAAMSGDSKLVKYLIEQHGADINIRDIYSRTVLHIAARKGNLKVVKYLIENQQLEVNAEATNNLTVLHYAARSSNAKLVKYLIEQGANVNAIDIDGKTVLHHAAEGGNLEVVKYLIENTNIDINVKYDFYKTALHIAIEKDNVDLVMYLVEHGANIKTRNLFGQQALSNFLPGQSREYVHKKIKESNDKYLKTFSNIFYCAFITLSIISIYNNGPTNFKIAFLITGIIGLGQNNLKKFTEIQPEQLPPSIAPEKEIETPTRVLKKDKEKII